MQEQGLDLSPHEAQPLTDQLVRHADLILTMTAGHAQAIIQPLSPPDVDRHAKGGAIAVPGAGHVAPLFAQTALRKHDPDHPRSRALKRISRSEIGVILSGQRLAEGP